MQSIKINRSEFGNYWAEPNRNGLTSYYWPKQTPALLAEVVCQYARKVDAQEKASELGFSKSYVREVCTRFHIYWVVKNSVGGFLCDERIVNILMMTDKNRDVRIVDVRAEKAMEAI